MTPELRTVARPMGRCHETSGAVSGQVATQKGQRLDAQLSGRSGEVIDSSAPSRWGLAYRPVSWSGTRTPRWRSDAPYLIWGRIPDLPALDRVCRRAAPGP